MLQHVEAVHGRSTGLPRPLMDPRPGLQLWQQQGEQARAVHQAETRRGFRCLQQADELVADPFGGHLAHGLQGLGDGGQGRRFHREAELGGEAAGSQRS